MNSSLTTRLLFRTRAAVLVSAAVVLNGAALSNEERLQQARNLGKAFYENPTTANEAVAEFRKALDLAPRSNTEKLNYALALLRAGKADTAIPLLIEIQKADPRLPHTWFNLGIYYRKAGDAEHAIEQFQGMLRLTPSEPVAHYQLGALYRQAGKSAEAIAEFEQAAKLNPLLAGAHFQLYNLYRQSGRTADAAQQLQTFQALKKQQEGAAVAEDVDWCNYAEIYDPPRPVTASPQPAPGFDDTTLSGEVDAKSAGLAVIDSTGKGDVDLLVWSARGAALYRHGSALAADSGLGELKNIVDIAAGDFDNDGLMDLCVISEAGPQIYRNLGGKFTPFEASLPKGRFERAVWLDYDHDYDLDLLLLGPNSALARNQGAAGFADHTSDFPFVNGNVTAAAKLRVVPDSKAFDLTVFYSGRAPVLYRDQMGGHFTTESWTGSAPDHSRIDADFDKDGKIDRARIAEDGSVHLMKNTTPVTRHWLGVQLAGVKSLKLGQDAEVEVKAGQLYRKQTYSGYPLLFDLGDHTEADVVRITWMNGLIQSETKQAANKYYRYEEAQRLSGSCPMIWTWNGREHQFITDVLGVAPLGASDGDGSFFPVDHDEYVSIPGEAMKTRDGAYDVRITEELAEVSYLDQIDLYAIDHAVGTEIYTNEKFKSPPYPDFRLFEAHQRIYPRTARDEKGVTVLHRILQRDHRYPDQFTRTESGIAEPHSLELDFTGVARSGHATLFLEGWVDWPEGSTFRAASQTSPLQMPALEMQDDAGRWQTVNPDMGMPAGKPKTIAVDLNFISASRKLRIVTNLCIYWDEIFLAENTGSPEIVMSRLPAAQANLHFRGFSAASIDPQRRQPDTYTYGPVSATSFWNPTPGMYTRYGDVRPLVTDVDDRFVIMGSGDELALRFPANTLSPLKSGWKRDFLLKVDGWAKDHDANTAYGSSVEPLPFHAMSVYPYPAREHYPADAQHEQYRREYNTRPALRLLRPLSD